MQFKEKDIDDAQAAGFHGLYKAIRRFDLEKGYQFSSHARLFIEGTARQWLRDHGHSVCIPKKWYELRSLIQLRRKLLRNRRREIYIQHCGRIPSEQEITPSDEEIAAGLKISVDQIKIIEEAWDNRNADALPQDEDGKQLDISNDINFVRPDSSFDSDELRHISFEIYQMPIPQISKDIMVGVLQRNNYKKLASLNNISESQVKTIFDESVMACQHIKTGNPENADEALTETLKIIGLRDDHISSKVRRLNRLSRIASASA